MLNKLENNGRHIFKIVTTTRCDNHLATEGAPCYEVFTGTFSSGQKLSGVCGKRIAKAGYVGKISPTSMSLRSPGGRSKPPKSGSTKR